jgi:hypothetical protein
MFKLGINVKAPVDHSTTLSAAELSQVRADLGQLLDEEGEVKAGPAEQKWELLEDLAFRVQPIFLENHSDKMNIAQVIGILDAKKRGKPVGSPDASIRVLRNVVDELVPLPCGKWKRVKTRKYANNNARLLSEPANNRNAGEWQWIGSECPAGRGNRPARRKTRKNRKLSRR